MTTPCMQDLPIATPDEDLLGVGAYARALTAYAGECSTPTAIAVQGESGSGKTSLCRLMSAELEQAGVKVVWFNAWRYAQIDPDLGLLEALTSHLAMELGGQLPMPTDDEPAAERLQRLQSGVADLLTGSVGLDGRVVFFIDDLEHLPPLQAVSFIETLKLLLYAPGAVTVLACRYATIERGLAQRHGVGEGAPSARDFFDKAVQVSFALPTARYRVERFFRAQLEQLGQEMSDASLTALIEMADTSVGFNPRAIKRVFSGVKLLRHLSDALPNAGPGQLLASDEEVTRVRFGALCLQNAYEPLYALLARSEVTEGLFAKLKSPETLATEPEFDALRAALCGRDGSGKTLRRVALFAAALERAVQLDLDDDQERLSPAEAHHLAETLRFAAVAAPHGYLDGTDMADRYRNEAMAAELADELNARYGETLDSLSTGRRFRMVTRRGLPDGGISVAYWNFRFGEHQMGLTLDFLPTGSAFWATAERRADRAFIHNLLQEAFPDAALPKEAWAYLLDEQEWRYGAPWPQRAQEFRNAATHFLDRFLPALVATAGKQD